MEGNAARREKGKLHCKFKFEKSMVSKDPLAWQVCPGNWHQSVKIFLISGDAT